MGEGLEQTFNDLWNERKQQRKKGSFGFLLRLFVDTALGIINERLLIMTRRDTMKSIIKSIGRAALISFILVLPFAILETLNNKITKQNAPGLVLLFCVLWLLPTVFILILMPIVRTLRTGRSLMANPTILLLRVASLTVIGTLWAWGFLDQLPCFLGVPNCD